MKRATARRLRWSAPVITVGLIVGGVQLSAGAANAAPDLPAISARDLLVKAQSANVTQLSGTVRSTAALGLPALPRASAGSGADWSSLVSGTQNLRVYADGPQQQRVDLVGDLTQASIVRSGRTVWTWSSETRQVTRTTLPAERAAGAAQPPLAKGLHSSIDGAQPPLTPQQAADQALAAVTPTTTVTVDGSAKVAGRPAYELRLVPQDAASLVGSVQVYVDAATGLALRTVVTPRGSSDPAVDIGFTALRLSAPAASTFRFTPPAGASVKDVPLPTQRSAKSTPNDGTRPAGAPTARTLGTGWSAVVETSALPPAATDASGEQPGIAAILVRAARPVSGSFGTGRLLSTRLLTVLQTADGRVFVGAVTPDELIRVAGSAAASPAR